MLFVGICPFLLLVCREWRWISLTRKHVFRHGLVFFFVFFFFSKLICISAFGPSLNPSNLILLLVGMFHLVPVVNRISFLCFGMSCFVYHFTLNRYLFNLPPFGSTFWFISSNCIVIFSCAVFSFLFLYILASFLCFIILACFCRFFYLHFRSNFPSWFWFFLRAFWRDLNFLTNFATV